MPRIAHSRHLASMYGHLTSVYVILTCLEQHKCPRQPTLASCLVVLAELAVRSNRGGKEVRRRGGEGDRRRGGEEEREAGEERERETRGQRERGGKGEAEERSKR